MSEIADVLIDAVEGDDPDTAASATLAASRLRLDPGDRARLATAVAARLRNEDVSADLVHAASLVPAAETHEAIRELLATDDRGLDARKLEVLAWVDPSRGAGDVTPRRGSPVAAGDPDHS